MASKTRIARDKGTGGKPVSAHRNAAIAVSVLLACMACHATGTADEQQAGAKAESSFARNFALYTSLTKKDGPLIDADPSDFKGALEGASDHSTANAVNTTVDTAIALKTLLAPSKLFGHSPVLFLFSANQLPHPALQNQIVAWMPEFLATDNKQAISLVKDKLFAALKESLPADYAIAEYTVTRKPLFGAAYTTIYRQLVGPGCPLPENLECRVEFFVQQPVKTSETPPWIKNGGDRYLWKNWRDGATSSGPSITFGVYAAKPESTFSEKQLNWLNVYQDEILHKMSHRLEDWIYIYAAPSLRKPYPAIYNQGRTHLFLQADAANPVSVNSQ